METEYTLIFSERRTLSLELRPDGQVVVRAPRSVSEAEVAAWVASKEGWLNKQRERLSSLPPPPTEEQIRSWRCQAEREIPARVARWAEIIGVRPHSVKITAAKKRFGSCSGKNGLCFSLYLMAYPPEAIDYVVVHELCHIVHKNHSARFHSLVKCYLPDAEARRALLRRVP